MAEEIQSPRSGAVYRGYMDGKGLKQAWGTQVWPDGGKYEGEWKDG
jgi:hypothetical protein